MPTNSARTRCGVWRRRLLVSIYNPMLSKVKAKRYLSSFERNHWSQTLASRMVSNFHTYIHTCKYILFWYLASTLPAPQAITGVCPDFPLVALCATALPQMACSSVLCGTGRSSDEGASRMVCADGRRASARRLLAHLVRVARRKFPH